MTMTGMVATPNLWVSPLPTADAPPLTDRVIRVLEAHAAGKAPYTVTCQQLAQRSSDPVARRLVGLIVEDEQRYRSLISSIVQRLKDESEVVPSPDKSDEPAGDLEMAARVRSLIRDQQHSVRHLRYLARHAPMLSGGPHPLLLETIATDCEKHTAMLRYLLPSIEEPHQ